MSTPAVMNLLSEGLAGSGLADMEQVVPRLARFCDLVMEWNGAVNLTACRSPEEVARTFVLEALQPLLLGLRPPGPGPLIDVGSGGGNPGISLALALPQAHVVLIEATGRKVGFLRHTVGALGLTNVEVRQVRAEELGHDPDWRELGALVTCRAVAPPPRACELGLSLARSGGAVWLYLSESDAATVAGQAAALEPLGVGAIQVVGAGSGGGVLCVLEKAGGTGSAYPRPEPRGKRNPLF